jgi:hypothetical protein
MKQEEVVELSPHSMNEKLERTSRDVELSAQDRPVIKFIAKHPCRVKAASDKGVPAQSD